MAQKFTATAAANYRPLLGISYVRALTGTLAVAVFFTMTDFFTSFIALNEGFLEGNTLVTGLSGTVGLGTIESLLITKAVFIAGVSSLAVVGAKSHERTTKKLALASLTIFVFVFACVTMNNLYWLVS